MQRDRPAERPSEPWLSFLTDLDEALDEPADFHCIGGFVVSQHYGFARETADLDVLTVIPPDAAQRVAELAGKGSPLQKKHRVYIDHVGVANYPDDYESRLVRMFPAWPKVACGRSNRTISHSRSWNVAMTATSATSCTWHRRV